jgi:dihydrofolate reductase
VGTICASVFLTLDGVMEAPHAWHPAYASEESLAILADRMGSATAMLLGRRTYEEFAGYWPHQPLGTPLAEATNGIRKYVVSQTLSEPGWANTTVLTGSLATAVRTLKNEEGDVLVPGGAHLVHGLLHEHLLDELHIMLDPIVVGSGRRLFRDGSAMTRLELFDSRDLPHGVTYLVYKPLSATAAQKSPA